MTHSSSRALVAFGWLALVAGCGTESRPGAAPGASCAQTPSEKNACFVAPGEFPPSDCDPSAKKCGGPKTCAIDESKCGTKSTCLPLASNDGRDIVDFRMRRLNIAAPDALAALAVQRDIITRDMDLPHKECGEAGDGTFNWLLRIDKTKQTLTTGGAPPSDDPFANGYCFFNTKQNGIDIRPATDLKLTFRGDAFSSVSVKKLYMPIFRVSDPKSAIILPISGATFRNVTLSEKASCIGAFNPSALAADCSDDPSACARWKTGGAIAGYITLEEADSIDVGDLHVSLCVLLTKSTPDANGKCARSGGKIVPKGDFCGATGKACDCSDSFWLAATFAASAVTINDGASDPRCNGGTP